MNTSFVSLEKIVRRAPLAVRCIDLAIDKFISDGLVVTANRINSRDPAKVAYRSPLSGIFGFHSLDFHAYEKAREPYGAELTKAALEQSVLDNACAPSPTEADVTKPNFILTVQDTLGRFLPQIRRVCLPKTAVYDFPLFSAPARPVMAGYGVIRMDLWDEHANRPASWAVVSVVMPNGADYLAHADVRGVAAIFIPFPPTNAAIKPDAPPDKLEWQPTIQVFYAPDQLRFPLENDDLDAPLPPDNDSLFMQAEAAVSLDPDATQNTFKYRGGLILKTPNQENTLNRGRLLITPS
jgi:hypothetical protein